MNEKELYDLAINNVSITNAKYKIYFKSYRGII